jgi:Ca2+:H+ antiporter
VFDGESTWLEGLALLGLYVIIAASVWYGPAIQP